VDFHEKIYSDGFMKNIKKFMRKKNNSLGTLGPTRCFIIGRNLKVLMGFGGTI